VLGQLRVRVLLRSCDGRMDALVFVLRALLLGLVFVHVYGDGEAFPECWVADACHCRCCCSCCYCCCCCCCVWAFSQCFVVLRLDVRRPVVVM
jgi:hypothetical protein